MEYRPGYDDGNMGSDDWCYGAITEREGKDTQ